jgi:transaldolase
MKRKVMKIFLDTANFENIKQAKSQGIIDGVTTNPTHLSKEGGDTVSLIKQICNVMDPFPVSLEITELEPEKTYQQAKKISAIASNVIVKIPCHKKYLEIIKKLVNEGVTLNITLLFSLTQALFMSKLGVKYISPFIGRLDDIDSNGIQLIYDIRQMLDNYSFETLLLAASLRTVSHVHEVILAGADIATIPIELVDKLIDHPLTDKGIKKFDEDWKKLDIKKFP